jgi:PIN domain nuclease of toxin-antitoxin system
MPSDCVVDAHALLWFFEGNPKLGPDARLLLADAGNRVFVPAIALAEACRVVEKGKSKIPAVGELFDAIDDDSRMDDRELVERSIQLTAISEMHDRLIVAAALRRYERDPSSLLVTADVSIRNSSLVPTRW